MANLKWHANELNKIKSDMTKPGRPSAPADSAPISDASKPDLAKRSRPNPLLRKLRNAQRHRDAQLARPAANASNVIPGAWGPIAPPPEAVAHPQRLPRGVLFALVPLSIIGMITLFIIGFLGSREIVIQLVGQEYMPAPFSTPTPQTAGARAEAVPSEPATDAASIAAAPASEATPPAVVAEVAAPTTQVVQPTEATAVSPSATVEAESTPLAIPTDTTRTDDTSAPVDNSETGTVAPPADTETAGLKTPDPVAPVASAAKPVQLTTPSDLAVADRRLVMRAIVETVFAERAAAEGAETETTPSATVATALPAGPIQPASEPAPTDQSLAPQIAAAQPEPLVRRENEDKINELKRERTQFVATIPIETPKAAEPTATSEATAAVETAAVAETTTIAEAATETAAIAATPNVTDVNRLIGQGQTLMAAGDVMQAREFFTRGLDSGSPEAALALGRSFDPKYLDRMPSSNARPDPSAARKWYEEWYRRSIEQGSVSPNVRLERLLNAINVN